MRAAPAQIDCAWRVAGGESAGGEGGGGDAEVAGGLVEAERQAAPGRAGQVDLHHHGHRPGQALIHTKKEIGGDDEAPAGGEANQDRYRQCHQPADHEQAFAAHAFGEATGCEIGDRLGGTERKHEGQDGGARAQPEVMPSDEWQDASL